MKIIILHPHITYPGGASKYMLEICERLAKKGWDLLVVTTTVDREIAKPYPRLKFHLLGGPTTGSFFFWLFYPFFQWRLHRFLNRFENKILFPQILPPIWWAGIYKKFHPQTPVVWMCQEPSAFVHSPLVIESLRQPMKNLVKTASPFLKIFDRFLVKDVDCIIANSSYGASLVKKTYKRKADLIAYPSVDFDRFKSQGKKENYIFTVSRLDKQKNIDVLLRAFELLPSQLRRKYKLFIGGRGTERKNLQNLAKKLGISKQVKFLGWVKEEKLPRWYAQAKLVVFCAQDEPFGIIPLEAMASGTVVIAANSGGVKETILEGKTGYLVEPQNPKVLAKKMAGLLDDQKKLQKMAKNAKIYVEKNFSWDKTTQLIEQFFKTRYNQLDEIKNRGRQ